MVEHREVGRQHHRQLGHVQVVDRVVGQPLQPADRVVADEADQTTGQRRQPGQSAACAAPPRSPAGRPAGRRRPGRRPAARRASAPGRRARSASRASGRRRTSSATTPGRARPTRAGTSRSARRPACGRRPTGVSPSASSRRQTGITRRSLASSAERLEVQALRRRASRPRRPFCCLARSRPAAACPAPTGDRSNVCSGRRLGAGPRSPVRACSASASRPTTSRTRRRPGRPGEPGNGARPGPARRPRSACPGRRRGSSGQSQIARPRGDGEAWPPAGSARPTRSAAPSGGRSTPPWPARAATCRPAGGRAGPRSPPGPPSSRCPRAPVEPREPVACPGGRGLICGQPADVRVPTCSADDPVLAAQLPPTCALTPDRRQSTTQSAPVPLRPRREACRRGRRSALRHHPERGQAGEPAVRRLSRLRQASRTSASKQDCGRRCGRPAPTWSTTTSTASPSQSSRTSPDVLHVARGVALAPVLLAAAAPERRPARGQRPVQRLVVHPADHQHLAGAVLLHDGGDQAVGVPLEPGGDGRVQRRGRVHAAILAAAQCRCCAAHEACSRE